MYLEALVSLFIISVSLMTGLLESWGLMLSQRPLNLDKDKDMVLHAFDRSDAEPLCLVALSSYTSFACQAKGKHSVG